MAFSTATQAARQLGKAARRKREPQVEGYLGGILDDLFVVQPYGELGYSRYHMQLSTIPDYGWLIMTKRLMSQSGAYPHQAANDLFQLALKVKGWKRLLVLEHDHTFPADVFRRHAQYKEPIVGAAYVLRDIESPLPVWFMWDKARANAVRQDAPTLHQMLDVAPGLYPVDCVPMGCTSISREVLENWPKDQPFFSSFINARGAVISHDVFFCRVAQDHGVQPYLDTRLQVSHYTLAEIDIPYFRKWWNTVGADRHGKQTIKDALAITAPADGTKQPKIMVAHTEDGLDPATKAALDGSGLGVVYSRVSKDSDYFVFVAALWAQGQTFITVEQDVVPTREQLSALMACPEPWCAFAYEYPPFGQYAGMGCAKFDASLIAKLPDALNETGRWHDEKHPPMHWCRVDGYLKQYLTEHGYAQHVHGIVEHHHKGRPAHDCVAMPDIPTSKYKLVTA